MKPLRCLLGRHSPIVKLRVTDQLLEHVGLVRDGFKVETTCKCGHIKTEYKFKLTNQEYILLMFSRAAKAGPNVVNALVRQLREQGADIHIKDQEGNEVDLNDVILEDKPQQVCGYVT
jgi:hypothetical protein